MRYIVPDIVFFVNGIPLVVVECKNPALTNPVEEGITQLLRYSRQQFVTAYREQSEAVPYTRREEVASRLVLLALRLTTRLRDA